MSTAAPGSDGRQVAIGQIPGMQAEPSRHAELEEASAPVREAAAVRGRQFLQSLLRLRQAADAGA